jgi:hypothetical protein
MAQNQTERELWEQQDGEGTTAFNHFVFYRDMRYPRVTRTVKDDKGNVTAQTTAEMVMDGSIPYVKRSLRKVAAAFNMNFRAIARQSEAGQWVKRCEAYDVYVDRKNREAEQAAIIKMRQEHALLAQQMIRKATRRLLKLPEDEINAAELTRMVDVAVKVERLSRGESTDNQSVTHAGEVEVKNEQRLDLSGLTNEELDQFEGLLAKISGAPDG